MSKANRKGEYDRLVAAGKQPPEVLVKEFGEVKPEPVAKETPKPVKAEPKKVLK